MLRLDKLNFDDFSRIFCKGIFKEALINVNKQFDGISKPGTEEVSLFVKIGEFQRKTMF